MTLRLRQWTSARRVAWRTTLAVVVILGGVACGGGTKNQTATQPRIVATTVLSARMRDLAVSSPAVGSTVKVRLLLPVHYSAQPQRRWPVLYLLHGCCDSYQSWTRSTDIEQLTAHSDVLMVMPDGGRVGFYSDWLAGPRWETFHLVELRRILQRDYRAGAAMAESMRYEGLIRSEGEDPNRLWGDPRDHAAVWAAHNPYDLAPKLRGTSLFLAVGTGQPGPLDPTGTAPDTIEPALAAQNGALAERLHALDIPAHLDFYGPGTHNWPYWQRDLHRAWPLLERALGIS